MMIAKPKVKIFALFCTFTLILTFFDPQNIVVWELGKRLTNPTFPKHHVFGLLGLWIAGSYVLWIGTVIPHRWRKFMLFLVLLMTTLNVVVKEVTQNVFSEFYYGISLAEWRFGYSFLANYSRAMLVAFFLSTLPVWLCFEIIAAQYKRGFIFKSSRSPSKIIVGLIVSLGIWQTFKYKSTFNASPSAISVPSTILFHHTFGYYHGPKQTISQKPSSSADANHIILIVDESVRADLMSVNGYTQNTTPFLKSYNAFINFGIASSSANCSRYSNTILRTGLRPSDLPDRKQLSLREPSLFQYAKQAGYHTAYITNHMALGQKFDNGMNEYDLAHIDSYIILSQETNCPQFGDCEVAHALIQLLQKHPKTFVYINKMGIHFPYNDVCPSPQKTLKDSSQQSQILTNYLNGMAWVSDKFLEGLLKELSSYDYLLFYTSDHAENVEEVQTRNGHGSFMGSNWKQAAVPLIIFTSSPSLQTKYKDVQTMHFNKLSHFALAPSLLEHLGFERTWVHEKFGPSILSKKRTPQRFFTGNIYQIGYWNNFHVPISILKIAQRANSIGE